LLRIIISNEKIDSRNKIYDALHNEARPIFKMVARKHNYINSRDFSVDWEDVFQELAASYLLYLDKQLHQGLLDDDALKPELIMRICQNTVVSIMRKIDSQKRGGGGSRMREKEDIVHLWDVPEDVLETTISEGVIVGQFLEWLETEDGSSYGVSPEDWELFTSYYIEGYTQQEVLQQQLKYTQQNLSRKLQQLGNNILPKLKATIQDLIIMENQDGR